MCVAESPRHDPHHKHVKIYSSYILWPVRSSSCHLCAHRAQMGALCSYLRDSTLRSHHRLHRYFGIASTDYDAARHKKGVNVFPGKKPIWDRLLPKTFSGLSPSIMLLSGQVEVHFVVLCRTIPIRSARKYIITVGMHQVEGQRQCLSLSDEPILLEIG
jgi:hypothetical protein